MLRSTGPRGAVFHNAPSVYPFTKPFHDTPYDQDRGRFDKTKHMLRENKWPAWMDQGADGTGFGIGLNRTHPLSKLRGNLRRNPNEIPRVLNMMIQGVWHKSGNKLYFRGGKPPNPSTHPYLTGEPCPVYGWKITDPAVIREFNLPQPEKDKTRYKPYVALQERKIMDIPAPSKPESNLPVTGSTRDMQELIETVNRYTQRGAALREKPTPSFASRQFLCSLLLHRQLDSIRLSLIAHYMFSTESLVTVSRDGVQTISCEGNALWPTCTIPNESTKEISGVTVTPGGTLLCSSDGIFYLEGKNPIVTEESDFRSYAQNILGISCTPDGRYIATGSGTALVTVWSSDLKPLHHLAGHTDWVRFVKFARGRSPALQLFSAGDDGVICQWDVLAGSLISRIDYSLGEGIQLFEVSFYSGLMAISSGAAFIALYCPRSDNTTRAVGEDVLRLQPMTLITNAHDCTPTAGKFTDDSQWLASASEDETIALTNVANPKTYFVCKEFVTRRRCFSFMNIFNSICILTAPPVSSVIVIAACSTDGTVVQWVVDPRTNRTSYTKKLQLYLGSLLGMDLIPADDLNSMLC